MQIGAALLLTLMFAVLEADTALADDWRYCLGVGSQQKIYLSEPFLAPQPYENIERAFRQALDANALAYESIQCPLSESPQDARQMREHTIRFNRERGMTIVEFRWRPAPGSAGR